MRMANPKRRHSKARKRKRSTRDAMTPINAIECRQCHEFKRPHQGCPSCGYYNGKEVIEVEEDDWFSLNEPITLEVTECCKIGPITNENYCPNCGKKIIKENE